MNLIVLIILIVPLFLMAVLAFVRQPDFPRLALSALVYGMAMVFLWVLFPWHLVSVWYKYLIALMYLAATVSGYRRIRRPEKELAGWQNALNIIISLAMIIFFTGLSWKALEGYPAPDGVIRLVSPLRDARFVVSNGGGSPFINGHARVRPQNHALDFLGLNGFGSQKIPFSDATVLENYAIFGAPIYSPCSGRVLIAQDGLMDLTPPAVDTQNLAGNHVLISCLDVEILLAHMKQGSVAVSPGQDIDENTVLGQVGNSGNTSEPHLHMHAEKGDEPGVILNGDAVPFTINGRYLVRGDTIQ